MQLLLAIGIGLFGAFLQSVSYLFSRRFVTKEGHTVFHLMGIAHLVMALVSIILLPCFWMVPASGWLTMFIWAIGTGGCYFIGQWFFFWSLKLEPASKISPLLGLKLLFIPILSVIFLPVRISLLQWCAVGMALLAGFLVNGVRGGVSFRAWLAILATCIGYSFSDLCIRFLIPSIDPQQGFRASIFALIWTYIICGIYGMVLFPRLCVIFKESWKIGSVYALTWYSSMACLFYSIALSGLVLAVVLQSTRAIISVGLGAWMASRGFVQIEHRVQLTERIRQLVGAILMCTAIALYVWSGQSR